MLFKSTSKKLNIVFMGIILCAGTQPVFAQSATVAVPDWAQPGSATHTQVPPPGGFHRSARTNNTPIGIFEGQSDVGAALVPGASAYNAATGQYTVTSAGYNVWYNRDEFRYCWKKMSGDVSLASDIRFPDTAGYDDRKAFLIIRQSLDDDSKEAVVALHGGDLLHLAWRPGTDSMMKEMRVNHRHRTAAGQGPDSVDLIHAKRIGIEKHGDAFSVYVSWHGEAMHRFGNPIQLHLDGPFYVGIGFCSHLPATRDVAVLSHLVLANSAGKVR